MPDIAVMRNKLLKCIQNKRDKAVMSLRSEEYTVESDWKIRVDSGDDKMESYRKEVGL